MIEVIIDIDERLLEKTEYSMTEKKDILKQEFSGNTGLQKLLDEYNTLWEMHEQRRKQNPNKIF